MTINTNTPAIADPIDSINPNHREAYNIEHNKRFDAFRYKKYSADRRDAEAKMAAARGMRGASFVVEERCAQSVLQTCKDLDLYGLLAQRYEMNVPFPVVTEGPKFVSAGTTQIHLYDDEGNVDESFDRWEHHRDVSVSALLELYSNFAHFERAVLKRVRKAQDALESLRDSKSDLWYSEGDPVSDAELTSTTRLAIAKLEAEEDKLKGLLRLDDPEGRYAAYLDLEEQEYSTDSAI